MNYQYLKIENRVDGIAIMKVSAPKSLNALNSMVLREIDDFVSNIDLAKVRALVVTGDGEKAFVAGADISEMVNLGDKEGFELSKLGATAFRKLEQLPIPTIAAVNGFALGGGCELSMACDMRIASSNAKFGQPEVGLGIIPGFSGTVRLSKLVGPAYAKELIYSGKMIDATEAHRIGLVNSVCQPEELMDNVINMLTKILRNAPLAIAAAKKCINMGHDLTIDEGIALESVEFGKLFATEDQKNGMSAFLKKEKCKFVGK